MEIAVNLFSNGLNLDQHPLTVDNVSLTDALNATIITNNGNELLLQNDMGNTLIQDGRTGAIIGLSEGFVPLGMKEYGGVLYIASYNPETEEGELGSIPSPLITYTLGQELNSSITDQISLIDSTATTIEDAIINKYTKISDCKLKPGDSFYISLNLKRSIDQICRNEELCGTFINNVLLPEDGEYYKSDKIIKCIFSNADNGRGLYNIELYTKTQQHGILPLTGIQNTEVSYYLNGNTTVQTSKYWFIDQYVLNSTGISTESQLNLDIKRSLSADSLLHYPNYPSGYLCIKPSLELPQIQGMLTNKSTGVKSPYLYSGMYKKDYGDKVFKKLSYSDNNNEIKNFYTNQGLDKSTSIIYCVNYTKLYTLDVQTGDIEEATILSGYYKQLAELYENQAVKWDIPFSYYYYIVIPGFYCNSGILAIDQIKIKEIRKNGALYTPNKCTWNTEGISRSSTIQEQKIEFTQPGENLEEISTFVQIFDSNTSYNQSIICPNNENSIIHMISNESTLHPGDLIQDDNNNGLFAFSIDEKELNSTFKITIEFYSKLPNIDNSSVSEMYTWKDGQCYLVVELEFYYTPKAVQLDAYSVLAAKNLLLSCQNPPKLTLNTNVLFGIKKGSVYACNGSGSTSTPYGSYDAATMCTSYLYPYIQFDLDNKNRIKGSRVCIGGFGNTSKEWAESDYNKGIYYRTTAFKSMPYHYYDSSNKSKCAKTWNLADPEKANTLGLNTTLQLRDKGLYCCNQNWFQNNTYTPIYNVNYALETYAVLPWTRWSMPIYKNIPFGCVDTKSGEPLMILKTAGNFVESFIIPNCDNGNLTAYDSFSSSNPNKKTVTGWKYRHSRNWVGCNLSGDQWFTATSYPQYSVSGIDQIANGGRYGYNRYLEFLYCCMRTFCPDAPILTKGWSTSNTSYKLFNGTWRRTYTIIDSTKFDYNMSYLYKKSFRIGIYNKSSSWFQVYGLVKDSLASPFAVYTINGEVTTTKSDTIIKEENKVINNNPKNIDVSTTNSPPGEYQDILSNKFGYEIKLEASLTQRAHNQIMPGLISIIPSYQLFVNLDTIDLNKNASTDRVITPYFYVINGNGEPFNSNLGVEQDKLVCSKTCQGDPWKYTITSSHNKHYMHNNTNDPKQWYRVDKGEGITFSINPRNDDNPFGCPSIDDSSVHILKVNGVCSVNDECYFLTPVQIQTCQIKYQTREGVFALLNSESTPPVQTDYLVFKPGANSKDGYEVTLTFKNDVYILSVDGFAFTRMELSTTESSEDGVFLYTLLDSKNELYPQFAECYVYCENGVQCINDTRYDIPQYPNNPYMRVYGYYNINPINDNNDYYNSGSGILYKKVSEFYTKDSLTMQTIETNASFYKN